MFLRLPLQCTYCEYGCTTEMMKTDLGAHEEECHFRIVQCMDMYCAERLPLASLLDHLANNHYDHEDFFNPNRSSCLSHFIVYEEDFDREFAMTYDHLTLDEDHFFRQCWRSIEGLWFVWVYYLGSHQDSKRFVYTVKITSEDKVKLLA